jgi:septin family protein
MYNACEPSIFAFETTDEIQEIKETIGQIRALKALSFGLGMENSNYNIFAIGESGTGKMTTIMNFPTEKAMNEHPPPDWCYVYNFKNPDIPSAVSLKPGKGREFQNDTEELIKYLRTELPKAFESKEYETQKQKQADHLSRLEQEAKSNGFGIKRTPVVIMIVPVKENGEVLTKAEFDTLEEREKRRLE